SDIVKDMYENGQLEEALGVQAAEVEAPTVIVTPSAAEAFKGALQNPEEYVHLEVDARFNHSLTAGPRGAKDIEVDAGPLTILVSRGSARRAQGAHIDFVDSPQGKAFKITNPNEPPKVRGLSV